MVKKAKEGRAAVVKSSDCLVCETLKPFNPVKKHFGTLRTGTFTFNNAHGSSLDASETLSVPELA